MVTTQSNDQRYMSYQSQSSQERPFGVSVGANVPPVTRDSSSHNRDCVACAMMTEPHQAWRYIALNYACTQVSQPKSVNFVHQRSDVALTSGVEGTAGNSARMSLDLISSGSGN